MVLSEVACECCKAGPARLVDYRKVDSDVLQYYACLDCFNLPWEKFFTKLLKNQKEVEVK